MLQRLNHMSGLVPSDLRPRGLGLKPVDVLVIAPSQPLDQIAAQVGYADRATFAKLFKQLCGETPGAFRKRLRQPLSE